VIFELQCKLGIKKTYKLAFELPKVMRPVSDKNKCANKIVINQTRSLDESIKNNFHTSVEEISFIVTENYLRVRSYIDDEAQKCKKIYIFNYLLTTPPFFHTKLAGKKILHTQIDLQKSDFGQYKINPNNEITFSLKMLKCILDFCEHAGQPVTIFFDQSGQPLILSLNYFNTVEIEFVLATLYRAENENENDNNDSTTTTTTTNTTTNRTMNSSQAPSSNTATNSSPPSSFRDQSSILSHEARNKRGNDSMEDEDSSSGEYVEVKKKKSIPILQLILIF
jgi:hypothetical protein